MSSLVPDDKKDDTVEEVPKDNNSSDEKKNCNCKKLSPKLIIVLCAIVIAAVVLLVFNLTGKHTPIELNQLKLYSAEDGKTYIAEGKKLLDESIDGEITGTASSLDMSSSAYATGSRDSGTLYFVNSKSVKKISSDVGDFLLSLNGESLLYICSVENGVGELHLYDTKSDKDELIDKSVKEISAVSPDGKSYIYSYMDSVEIDGNRQNHLRFRLNVSGETSELDGIVPVALADAAEYIYYTKDGNLYARKGNADMNIGLCEGEFLFSSNMYEVIFMSDKKYYISCCGSEKLKLSDASPEIVLSPDSQINTGTVITKVSDGKTSSESLTQISVAPFESFVGRMYVSSGNLWEIDKEYSSSKLFSKCTETVELNGSKNIFYMTDDGSLGYFKRSKADDREIIAANVSEFFVIDNGKAVYYLVEAKTASGNKLFNLMYSKVGEEAVELAANVSSAAVSGKDIVYYVINESDTAKFMSRKAADEAVLIREDSKKNNTVISDLCGNVFLKVSEKGKATFDLYFVKGKAKLEPVASNVS